MIVEIVLAEPADQAGLLHLLEVKDCDGTDEGIQENQGREAVKEKEDPEQIQEKPEDHRISGVGVRAIDHQLLGGRQELLPEGLLGMAVAEAPEALPGGLDQGEACQDQDRPQRPRQGPPGEGWPVQEPIQRAPGQDRSTRDQEEEEGD